MRTIVNPYKAPINFYGSLEICLTRGPKGHLNLKILHSGSQAQAKGDPRKYGS